MQRSKAETHEIVRDTYGKIASRPTSPTSCCGTSTEDRIAKAIGYSDEELGDAPTGANLGVGCGNPVALASLRPGDTVLDLGSGAGFDAFIAARIVGPQGRVVGVDMTDEMLERARENARTAGVANVEFRKGTIEELPFDDATFDVVISNCVINLAADKAQVFREAHRVLRPGGTLAVSDVVLEHALPPEVLHSTEAYTGCVAGAMLRADYIAAIESAGFQDVRVVGADGFGELLTQAIPDLADAARQIGITEDEARSAMAAVTSLKVTGRR